MVRRYEAISAQLLTATGAMIGVYIGVSVQSYQQISDMVLAATCGGFVYLSTVVILPTLIQGPDAGHCEQDEECDHHHHHHHHDCSGEENSSTLSQIVCDSFGFAIGVFLMVTVTWVE